MGWILLAIGALFLLLTLNSFRPVRRNRVLFVPSFFASWLTNELAPFYAVVTAGLALFTVGSHGLATWEGWLALVLLAATLALLVVLYLRGTKATAELASALGDFGQDERSVARSGRRRYRRHRDIEFARVGGRRLRLDVIEPTAPVGPGAKRPAILQIHGGGWVIGDKREQGWPLLKYLAANGWVGFNANYRLSPGATWPDHLVDCKRALAWIREHADDYDIDPGFVVVTGGSAGGHLTAMMALTANDPKYQPGFEEADTSVQAAAPFYGVYDFTNRLDSAVAEMRTWILEPLVMKAFYDEQPELFESASPMDQVHEDAPPFLVIHGTKDTLAPVADAREFVRLLGEVSDQQVFYVELDGAQHAFDIFSSPRTRRVIRGVERFLYGVYDAYINERDTELRPPDEGDEAPPEEERGPEDGDRLAHDGPAGPAESRAGESSRRQPA